MPSAWREDLVPGRDVFLGLKEGSEEFGVGTPAVFVVCRTVKGRPREDAADRVFCNSIRPRRLVPDGEPREPTQRAKRATVVN